MRYCFSWMHQVWVWSQHSPAILASGKRRPKGSGVQGHPQRRKEYKVGVGYMRLSQTKSTEDVLRACRGFWHIAQEDELQWTQRALELGRQCERVNSHGNCKCWQTQLRHTPPEASSVPNFSSLGTKESKPGASILFKKANLWLNILTVDFWTIQLNLSKYVSDPTEILIVGL